MNEVLLKTNEMGNSLVLLLQKIINVFIVDGITANFQQITKLTISIILIMFFFGFLFLIIKVIKDLLSPLINQLGKQEEYLFCIVVVFIASIVKNNNFAIIFPMILIILIIQIIPLTKIIMEFYQKNLDKIPKENSITRR